MTKILAIPHIHSNGTSRDVLVDDLCDAMNAIGDALNAIRDTAPNRRDYYTLPPVVWENAVAQHKARMDKLREVLNELEAIAEAVA